MKELLKRFASVLSHRQALVRERDATFKALHVKVIRNYNIDKITNSNLIHFILFAKCI